MITIAFLVKLFAPLLARAMLTKLLGAELSQSDVAETLTDSLGLAELVDIISSEENGKRAARFFFTDISEAAAESLKVVFDADSAQITPAIIEQTAETVAQIFEQDGLPLLMRSNLDRASFEQALRRIRPPSSLPVEAHELFDRLLMACGTRIYLVAETVPNFTRESNSEILVRLARSQQVVDEILKKFNTLDDIYRDSLNNNPQAKERAKFEEIYRNRLVETLDRMDLFGVSSVVPDFKPPLSAAFIAAELTVEQDNEEKDSITRPQYLMPLHLKAAQAVTQASRLLIVGDAGMGKTTLLRWVTVRLAEQDFTGEAHALRVWQGKVPIYLPLRRFAREPLPNDLDQLPLKFLENNLPRGREAEGWTKGMLDEGRCVLLVDGLDEISEEKCAETLGWLMELLRWSAPDTPCLVTTRPSTLTKPEIGQQLHAASFVQLKLRLMDDKTIAAFVDKWHVAMADPRVGLLEAVRRELPDLASKLKKTLNTSAPLNDLARNPLLCAMICAVNQKRGGWSPENRLELYDVCIDMVLEKRDDRRDVNIRRQRFIAIKQDELRRRVGKLAYWMMKEGVAVVSRRQACRRLSGEGSNDGAKVLELLIERCYLLRSPTLDEFEFTHRSFQEFLTAKQILFEEEVGTLAHAYVSQQGWRETILLVAGLTQSSTLQERLLQGILESARQHLDEQEQNRLHILALEAYSQMNAPKQSTREIASAHAEQLIEELKDTDTDSLDYKLILNNAQMSDVTALGKLTQLHQLHLMGTQVSNVTALGKLTKLQMLWLDRTQVSDVTALSKLTKLQLLSLNDTQVSDVTALSKLMQLHDLYLNETQVSDVTALSKLTKLQALWLDRTQVSDLTALSKLTKLQTLWLDYTQVSDVITIGNLTQLKDLSLTGTQIDNVTALGNLTQLHTLWMNSVQVSDVTALGNLTQLQTLYLSNTQVSDVTALGNLTQLQRLYLNDTQVSDVTALGNLTQLRDLRLSNTQVSDVTALGNLTQLRELYLNNTQVSDVTALGNLTQLRELYLNNTQVSDVTALGNLTQLQLLSIAHSHVYSLSALTMPPNIWVLDIRNCLIQDFLPLLMFTSLRAVWVDDSEHLPPILYERLAINPTVMHFGEGPSSYLRWLKDK